MNLFFKLKLIYDKQGWIYSNWYWLRNAITDTSENIKANSQDNYVLFLAHGEYKFEYDNPKVQFVRMSLTQNLGTDTYRIKHPNKHGTFNEVDIEYRQENSGFIFKR